MNDISPFAKQAGNNKRTNIGQINTLWQKIEALETEKKQHQQEVSSVNKLFEDILLPHEQALAAATLEKVSHLINFMTRKSFSERQRSELFEWLEDDLNYLQAIPFAESEQLEKVVDEYNSQIDALEAQESDQVEIGSEQFDNFREMIFDTTGIMPELSDEQILEMMKGGEAAFEIFMKDLMRQAKQDVMDEEEPFNTEDEEGNSVNFERHENPFERYQREFEEQQAKKAEQEAQQQSEKASQLNNLFKSSELNKMYKKLASKLHPDKEPDSDKKAQKQALMQQASAARESNDAFTIIKLYHDHVDSNVFDFGKDGQKALKALLKEKVEMMEHELDTMRNEPHIDNKIWLQFAGKTDQQTKLNLQGRVDEIAIAIENAKQIRLTLKTVKALKPVLSERADQKRWTFDGFGF